MKENPVRQWYPIMIFGVMGMSVVVFCDFHPEILFSVISHSTYYTAMFIYAAVFIIGTFLIESRNRIPTKQLLGDPIYSILLSILLMLIMLSFVF